MLPNPKISTKNLELLEKTKENPVDEELFYNKDSCPICGQEELIVEGRCTTCMNCGWSKCSI